MTEKQNNFLDSIKKELQNDIDRAERRNKQERKDILLKLQKIVDSTDFDTNTFSVLVEICKNYGFANFEKWQNYIWQNTVLQENTNFEWVKELAKQS